MNKTHYTRDAENSYLLLRLKI